MNRTELLQRLDGTEWVDFEVKSATGGGFEDLDDVALGWLRGLIALRNPTAFDAAADVPAWLAGMGLVRKDGALTHAAALLFGKPQVMASLKPGGVADFRVMHSPAAEGMPAHRWDDRELCEGHLVSTLRSLFERIHRLCPQPFALEPEGPHRRARALEEEALREALVNLLVHQDYADVQRTATILWWRDQVIFSNPGDSFVPTPDLWTGGFSESRNPLVCRVLRQAGLAEQAGSGLPFVLRTWAESGRPAPELRNDGGRKRFEAVFTWGDSETEGVSEGVTKPDRVNEPVNRACEPVNEPLSQVHEPVNEPVSPPLSERLLEALLVQPGLRVPALVANVGVSASSVKRALVILQRDGRIVFRGAPKTGGYYPT